MPSAARPSHRVISGCYDFGPGPYWRVVLPVANGWIFRRTIGRHAWAPLLALILAACPGKQTSYDSTNGKGSIPKISGLTGFCKTIRNPLVALVGPTVVLNLGTFNSVLKTAAWGAGGTMVPSRDGILGHGFNYQDKAWKHYKASDPTLWFHKDCAHGDNRGHHELRRLIRKALPGFWRRFASLATGYRLMSSGPRPSRDPVQGEDVQLAVLFDVHHLVVEVLVDGAAHHDALLDRDPGAHLVGLDLSALFNGLHRAVSPVKGEPRP